MDKNNLSLRQRKIRRIQEQQAELKGFSPGNGERIIKGLIRPIGQAVEMSGKAGEKIERKAPNPMEIFSIRNEKMKGLRTSSVSLKKPKSKETTKRQKGMYY